MKTNETAQTSRANLKNLSAPLADLKKNGKLTTINEGLKSIYNLQGHSELKTFEQWEKEGKRIKKGEKALYLWGRQTEMTVTENGEKKEITFFPLVAVFSENQVYTPQNN